MGVVMAGAGSMTWCDGGGTIRVRGHQGVWRLYGGPPVSDKKRKGVLDPHDFY